ncbi:hypothetical protein BSPWISOXPB_4840 [uncultured Gammaproteobacteria bacterium]|nr:hypothetical protein BSPWISOXPB_4840 [uncultured Gammaproteobacteria bacterium]
MVQSRRGVKRVGEAQVHPMIVAISRFIQLIKVLPLLKPMAQSRHGVFRVQVRPLILDTLRFFKFFRLCRP